MTSTATTSPRYAIYLAPDTRTRLWHFGSALLGYDAVLGKDVAFPPRLAMAPETWRAITEDPRRYGLHITLKAPFRLKPEMTIEALDTALAGFARQTRAFDVGALTIECRTQPDGRGFVCFAPAQPSAPLAALEQAVVRDFDAFRAPLTDAERARRRPEQLNERQREQLDAFGYPYIFADYRPHLSLTGFHANAAETADHIADLCAAELGQPTLTCDALWLFEQASPEHRFTVRALYPLVAG